MKVEPINLDDSFNRTSIPSPVDRTHPSGQKAFDPGIFEQIIYRCVGCSYQIAFSEKDFKKHNKSPFSNLSLQENNLFEEYVQEHQLSHLPFVDFHCPTCQIPTRLHYSNGLGGKGQYWVNIEMGLILR